MMPSDLFDNVWDRLSFLGGCDDWGSQEYRRVRAAWRGEGCPWLGICDLYCMAAGWRHKVVREETKAALDALDTVDDVEEDDEEGY